MIRFKKTLALMAIPAICGACFSDLLIDEVRLAPWETTIALPLLKSEITMGDMVSRLDSNYINTKSDGLIYFSYQDTLISYKIADLVTIPSQSVSQSLTLPMPTISTFSVSQSVSIASIAGNNFSAGAPLPPFSGINHTFDLPVISQFESATFESGTLSIRVGNTINTNFQFTLELVNKNTGAQIGQSLSFNVPPSGSQTLSISLAQLQVPKNLAVRMRNISSGGTSQNMTTADGLSFRGTFQNMALQQVSLKLTEPYTTSGSTTATFPLPYGIEAYEMSMLLGNASFSFTSNLNASFSIALTLPTSKNASGQPLSSQLQVQNGSGSGSLNLAGASLDMSKGSQGFNQVPVSYTVNIPASSNVITFNKQSQVQFSGQFSRMDFNTLRAYLGNETFSLESDTLNLSVFQNTLAPTVSDFTIALVNPKLDFTVTNEYGVPFQFTFLNTQVANRNDQKLPILFSENPVTIAQGSVSSPIVKQFGVTNLNELFSFKPRVVFYGAGIKLNPSGKAVNTINRDQNITIEVNAEIPLHGRISTMYIEADTFPIDFTADGSLEAIKRASFKASFSNGLPLEFEPQFYMLDEQGNMLDSLFDGNNTLLAAQVDANGYVTSQANSILEVNADAKQIESLMKTTQIVFTARLVTAENGNKNIRILDTNKIQASMGIIADILVKSKN